MRILPYTIAAITGATLAVSMGLVIDWLGGSDNEAAPAAIAEMPPSPPESSTTQPTSNKDRGPETRPATYADLLRGVGGEKVAAILRSPDKVEGVLLKPPDWKRQYKPHEYLVVSEPVTVRDDIAAHIAESLLTPELHRIILAAKGCAPVYGVRITYWAADDRADLYFCFECAILMVYLSGDPVGGMSFDSVGKRLQSDAVTIFPAEPGLVNVRDRTKDRLTPVPTTEDGLLAPPAPREG